MMDKMTIEFEGVLASVEKKTSAKGTAFANMVVDRSYDYKGETKHEPIPLTAFGDAAKTDAGDGDVVKVTARVGGREYNGKFYAQLTATKIEAVQRAAHPAPEQAAEAAEDSGSMPF